MTTFESVCLLFNLSIEASSVDPDQTAPIGAVRFASTLLLKML